jgi:hypothetical protein
MVEWCSRSSLRACKGKHPFFFVPIAQRAAVSHAVWSEPFGYAATCEAARAVAKSLTGSEVSRKSGAEVVGVGREAPYSPHAFTSQTSVSELGRQGSAAKLLDLMRSKSRPTACRDGPEVLSPAPEVREHKRPLAVARPSESQ